MKKTLLLLILLVAVCACGVAQSSQRVRATEPTAVDLTIYNQNLSLIREERTIKLPRGTSSVIVPNIAQTIDGTSVHFLSLTQPDAVKVLEQNYQYDLVNQQKLLEKYLGKEIEFVRMNEETKKEYTVRGTLLSNIGGIVAQVDEKIEINPSGKLVLPSLPEGLIVKPQLEWLVSNTREGEHKTEISYLAGQLSWSCNYVVVLNKTDEKLDLTGWVTLTNNSGTSFKNAGLKLVAGDVNLVQEKFNRGGRVMAMTEMDASGKQFEQTELFEYKLYTLQRRADVLDNETKQIELTTGKNIDCKKVFIYDGMANEWRWYANNHSYRSEGSFGQQSNPKVGVFVTFRNEESAGLGIALPKGKIRVYKRDTDGKEQFIGEDEIDHTPKDEELRLYLGNAFDLVGERVQKDFKSFASGKVVEETIELTIRNHKNETAEVMVYEHPWRWGEWEITKTNTNWEKVDQSTVKFPVNIAKDGEKKIIYTIRYSW